MSTRRKPPTRASSTSSTPPPFYDPLQFVIRARNDNDHSDYLPKVQVTPELKAEVEAVANSGVFEFDSTAAFQRWCYVHGLEFLKRLRPEYPSNVSIIRAMEREHAALQTKMRFLDHIELQAKAAFELVGRGMKREAGVHVFRILSEIRKLHPEDPWRAVYEKEMKKRFGMLLKLGKIVSHVPVDDGPQPAPDWENAPVQ